LAKVGGSPIIRVAVWDPVALNDPKGRLLQNWLLNQSSEFDVLQVRHRRATQPEKDKLSKMVANRPDQLRLWINRDIAWALQLNADGVQLGIEDAESAKGLAGRISFGFSVHSVDEWREVCDLHPGWVLYGHVKETASKPSIPGRGWPALKSVADVADPTPVIAIGGLTVEDEVTAQRYNAAGIAMIRGAFQSEN